MIEINNISTICSRNRKTCPVLAYTRSDGVSFIFNECTDKLSTLQIRKTKITDSINMFYDYSCYKEIRFIKPETNFRKKIKYLKKYD